MLIKEFRVTLPVTVNEYQVGQLWSVAESSKQNTGGGEGIEVQKNEPFEGKKIFVDDKGNVFDKGQYTYKIYHLQSRIPAIVRFFMPKGSMEIHEEAWNAFPYCRTIITNPGYMKENFRIAVETMHLPDRGTSDNAHNLSQDLLNKREVVNIDIANDPIQAKDYKEDQDPQKVKSEKTGRGPLKGPWKQSCEPVMTCYKQVTCEFKWFGMQGRVEKFIQDAERRIFFLFHRQVYSWLDNWHGLTMDDIRRIEDETKLALDDKRKNAAAHEGFAAE